jgi:hypothetical protein
MAIEIFQVLPAVALKLLECATNQNQLLELVDSLSHSLCPQKLFAIQVDWFEAMWPQPKLAQRDLLYRHLQKGS